MTATAGEIESEVSTAQLFFLNSWPTGMVRIHMIIIVKSITLRITCYVTKITIT